MLWEAHNATRQQHRSPRLERAANKASKIIKVGRKWRESEESKLRYDDDNEVVCLKLRRDDIIVG